MGYQAFKNLLEQSETTTYRVAKETGLDPSMFTNWKNGRYKPKVDKLQILAEYFGVPVETFLED